MRNLPAHLNKSKKYVFSLTTRVNDEYVARVGKPNEGTASITLLPSPLIIDTAVIKFVKYSESNFYYKLLSINRMP